MTIQSLLVLLVDGTNRADLQKDDWRGDIDGLQQDFLEETSNRNRTKDDLESGVVEEVSDSDDEEDPRNLIFDAEELDEGRTETNNKKKDEDADEIGFLGESSLLSLLFESHICSLISYHRNLSQAMKELKNRLHSWTALRTPLRTLFETESELEGTEGNDLPIQNPLQYFPSPEAYPSSNRS